MPCELYTSLGGVPHAIIFQNFKTFTSLTESYQHDETRRTSRNDAVKLIIIDLTITTSLQCDLQDGLKKSDVHSNAREMLHAIRSNGTCTDYVQPAHAWSNLKTLPPIPC